MIGKYIKGVRHLKNNVSLNTMNTLMFLGHDGKVRECLVGKMMFQEKEYIVFFSEILRYCESSNYDIVESFNAEFQKAYHSQSRFYAMDCENIGNAYFWFQALCHTDAILLPQNYKEEYQKFCDNNKKLFSSLFVSYYDQNKPICKYVYALSNGSANMFVWALTNASKGMPMHLIRKMLYWFDNYSQFNGKLSRGSMTSYNEYHIFKLQNELVTMRKQKRVNNVINLFNTVQKKVLREYTITSKEENILSRFDTLSKEKQRNFIRKMSTVENAKEIFHQMALLTKTHFEWNRDSFLDFIHNIEGLDFSIVFDNNNIVILQVKNYDTIKYVTKTTNWCISKNKRYWDDYVKPNQTRSKHIQYVLFDFNQKEDSELSIVGFTTKNESDITHAHSFTNNNLMNENRYNIICKTFDGNHSTVNIHSILNKLSIPSSIFIRNDALPYKWEKRAVIEILNEHILEDNYEILKENENQLIITVNSSNVIMLIGYSQYCKVISEMSFNPLYNQHILFFDFSKESDDKLYWGFIDEYEGIEDCTTIFNVNGKKENISCDYLLIQNDIPYHLFKRPKDDYNIIMNAIMKYDFPLLSLLLKKGSIKALLRKDSSLKGELKNILVASLCSIYTPDLLNMLYDNDFKLLDLFTESQLNNLMNECIRILNEYKGTLKQMPSKDIYDKVFNGTFNPNKSIPYGIIYAMEMILRQETSAKIINDWVKNITLIPSSVIRKYIIDLLLTHVSETTSWDKLQKIIQIILKTNYLEGLEKLSQIKFSIDISDNIYNSLDNDNPLKNAFAVKQANA